MPPTLLAYAIQYIDEEIQKKLAQHAQLMHELVCLQQERRVVLEDAATEERRHKGRK